MEPVEWIASFSRPDMDDFGSGPVVQVWEDESGWPETLVEPIDQNGSLVKGTWRLDGRSARERVAHYELLTP